MLDHLRTILLTFALLAAAFTQALGEENVVEPAARSVIDNQIKSFRSGNHDQAFSHASPNLKKMFGTTENFIRMVKSGYGAIYGAQNWSFGRSRMVSGTLYQEVQIVGPKGNNWTALYSMQQQADGSWKITAVQMKRDNARTT